MILSRRRDILYPIRSLRRHEPWVPMPSHTVTTRPLPISGSLVNPELHNVWNTAYGRMVKTIEKCGHSCPPPFPRSVPMIALDQRQRRQCLQDVGSSKPGDWVRKFQHDWGQGSNGTYFFIQRSYHASVFKPNLDTRSTQKSFG